MLKVAKQMLNLKLVNQMCTEYEQNFRYKYDDRCQNQQKCWLKKSKEEKTKNQQNSG